MISIKKSKAVIELYNDDMGESQVLIDFGDPYQNLTNIRLIPHAEESEENLSAGFISQMKKTSEKENLTNQERALELFIAAELYRLFMTRNQSFYIYMNEEAAGRYRGTLEAALAVFHRLGQAVTGGRRELSLFQEDAFYAALLGLAGARDCDFEELGQAVRAVCCGGRILLYEDYQNCITDSRIARLLSRAERRGWESCALYVLTVTRELKELFSEDSPEAETMAAAEEFAALWNTVSAKLGTAAGSGTGDGERGEGLEPAIAALHSMEENILRLYPHLDNLNMKILTNWLKTAAMDLYLEIRAEGERIPYYRQRLGHRLQEFTEAFAEEFTEDAAF